MVANEQIARLVQQVLAAIPDTTQEVKDHLHHALQSALQRMDVVTREEFEVQTALLQRSREKLAILEKQMAELERHVISK